MYRYTESEVMGAFVLLALTGMTILFVKGMYYVFERLVRRTFRKCSFRTGVHYFTRNTKELINNKFSEFVHGNSRNGWFGQLILTNGKRPVFT